MNRGLTSPASASVYVDAMEVERDTSSAFRVTGRRSICIRPGRRPLTTSIPKKPKRSRSARLAGANRPI
ncbi:unnamed protein product [Leptosia nina]|uniref:Uncharacterized protein n=1 Tax=Leptosia nina TaxID=320188 RepID=A0AAV1IUJ3_9NEOP